MRPVLRARFRVACRADCAIIWWRSPPDPPFRSELLGYGRFALHIQLLASDASTPSRCSARDSGSSTTAGTSDESARRHGRTDRGTDRGTERDGRAALRAAQPTRTTPGADRGGQGSASGRTEGTPERMSAQGSVPCRSHLRMGSPAGARHGAAAAGAAPSPVSDQLARRLSPRCDGEAGSVE